MNIEKYINEFEDLIKTNNFNRLESLCLRMAPIYEESFLYYYIGLAQVNMGLIDSGSYFLRKSIFLNPNAVGGYNILGDLYLRLNKFDLAENLLSKSIELSAKNLSIHILYVKTLIKIGDNSKCLKAINYGLTHFENSKELTELKELLK